MYKLKIFPSWVHNDSAPFVGKTFSLCECRCRLLSQVTAFVWGLSEFLFGSTFSLVPRLRCLNYCGSTEHVSFVRLNQTRPFTLLYRFQYRFVSSPSKKKMCQNLKIKMI